ncbi:hypothetical protein NBRC110019_03470 [Neptunitalea chrysea]|uniref:Metallo-beta-lactamase domain-containing protein n=1 Tax=Neptunitalea chrysea TaxID=1647581 RepID=A0A9W6EVA8_9FLAO|nr:MBL fold metallo-hydrolase [Neptunitalea chrysea]GLB51308.1 hypothetical protein NBRC110019_03470 [Neptunitalea chrysea]
MKKLCITILTSLIGLNLLVAQVNTYPKWEEGILEIHHINTGRGDAAYFILPDGTTMLVDAGDTSETHPRTLSVRNAPLTPNRSKTAPQWIVDYIKQFSPKVNKEIDYAIITHYHDDHFGEVDSIRKISDKGDYQLTGITEVGTLVPIHTLIDRGSSFPIDLKDTIVQRKYRKDTYHMVQTLTNYWKFIDYQSDKNGLKNETLIPGKLDQIQLVKSPKKYTNFHVRNIAVNGAIWTGEKEYYFDTYKQGEYHGENDLSTCIKITYGNFDYFTGGDISGVDAYGQSDFSSMESLMAPVIGPVDVITLNHHGNRNSQNIYYVRTVRPRVWIQQNWSSDHPGEEVFRRISSKKLYPGDRDMFATVMLQPNKDVIGEKLNNYKSQEGHIVVRVYDNGNFYEIYVLDDTTNKRTVKAKFGPYECR